MPWAKHLIRVQNTSLPYPGGPLVDQHAQLGNPKAFVFTKPKVPGLNFSFSGLKQPYCTKEKLENPDFSE
jgi:N6-L-threonylcarbamoyladenine synthase